MPAEIRVVGSINMDVVNRVERHPKPGETVHGLGTSYHPGGKGANQAVAAARAGAHTRMLGAVGEDGFGDALRSALAQAGVDVDGVAVKTGTSGLAFITVSGDGENTILLSAGANGRLTADDLDGMIPPDVTTATDTDARTPPALLLQNEIPWPVTLDAMRRAGAAGWRVYLNPAPSLQLPAEAYALIDVLILNESEAEDLTARPIQNPPQAEQACRHLLARGIRQLVVLTRGAAGAVAVAASDPELPLHTPACPVEAVDTTAAGDTFIGSFAVAYEEGRPIGEALRFASAAAALAVTRHGAQPSIPTRAEIVAFLASQPKREV